MCNCEDAPCCGCHLEEDKYPPDPLDFFGEMEDKYGGNIPEQECVMLKCLECGAEFDGWWDETNDCLMDTQCPECDSTDLEG